MSLVRHGGRWCFFWMIHWWLLIDQSTKHYIFLGNLRFGDNFWSWIWCIGWNVNGRRWINGKGCGHKASSEQYKTSDVGQTFGALLHTEQHKSLQMGTDGHLQGHWDGISSRYHEAYNTDDVSLFWTNIPILFYRGNEGVKALDRCTL